MNAKIPVINRAKATPVMFPFTLPLSGVEGSGVLLEFPDDVGWVFGGIGVNVAVGEVVGVGPSFVGEGEVGKLIDGLVPVGVVYCSVYWPLSIDSCTAVHFDSTIGGSFDKWNTSLFGQKTSVLPFPSELAVHPVRITWFSFVVRDVSLFDDVDWFWMNPLWFKRENTTAINDILHMEMTISRRCFNKIW